MVENLSKRTAASWVTVLAVVVYVDAFMWLVGVVPTLYYAFTYRTLPELGGITLMGGPFERLGLDGFIVAGIVFILVSALKVLAAYWIWGFRKDGAVLQMVLLGLSVIFWYGFALPLGPLLGITQVVLLPFAWRFLR